jgi:hypothetical protein
MTVSRRTFILGTAVVATAPALAELLTLSSTAQSHASLLPGLLPPQRAADGADTKCALFKICGWDRYDDLAIDGATMASADAVTHDPAGEQEWISINRSWRSAWR